MLNPKINNNSGLKLSNITYIAILTAISFILYLIRVPLPFFPTFLHINFADVPTLIGALKLGPLPGFVIVFIRMLLKLPNTTTGGVGEMADLVIGGVLVIIAGLIYKKKRNIYGAIIALIVGVVVSSLIACLVNRYILFPLYIRVLFKGKASTLIRVIPKNMRKNATVDNMYRLLIFGGVLPFNLFKGILNAFVAFVIYKTVNRLFEIEEKVESKTTNKIVGINGMRKFAYNLANELKGGEKIILEGELGAGKTTFTKYLCEALGVKNTVTSPTFTIMNEYYGKYKIYHIDMYRLESEDEIEEVGIRELIEDPKCISIIEWNKFKNLTGMIYWISIKKTVYKNFRRINLER